MKMRIDQSHVKCVCTNFIEMNQPNPTVIKIIRAFFFFKSILLYSEVLPHVKT